MIFEGKADGAGVPVHRRRAGHRSATRRRSGARTPRTPSRRSSPLTAPDAKVACIGPAGREPGALRLRDERHGPRCRAVRRRRRDGLEEPQGHRRARHRRRQGRRSRALHTQASRAATPPSTTPTPSTSIRPARRACSSSCTPTARCRPRTSSSGVNPEYEKLTGEVLADTHLGAQAHGHGLSRLPDRLRPRQSHHEPRLRGHRRGPGVRDHRHVRLELLHERLRAGLQGQLHLQPDGHGHHLRRQLDRLRDGDVRGRPHPRRRTSASRCPSARPRRWCG